MLNPEYDKTNKSRATINRARRRHIKSNRTPKWLTRELFIQIKTIQKNTTSLTKSTGIAYATDHIIPLVGDNISGLHIPSNLRSIPVSSNNYKANGFSPYTIIGDPFTGKVIYDEPIV